MSPKNTTYTCANVTLEFTINKQTSWMGYSRDGQETATIAGNTTLSGLSIGLHKLIVYANAFENIVAYETVWFNVAEPFPTILVIASITTLSVIGIGALVYFKKRRH